MFIAVVIEALLHEYYVIQTKAHFDRYQLIFVETAAKRGAERLLILLAIVISHYILAL